MVALVGILNLTPDSFSDGGAYGAADQALAHVEAMVEAGADVIDIGAESTRPGATPLKHAEEWARLAPVLQRLAGKKIVISVDTYHPETARKSLDYGVAWINDVSGFTNPAMVEAVRESTAKLVFMHNLGVPADRARIIAEEKDAVAEVLAWGRERIEFLGRQGIAKERLVFDPGIGFGKNAQQSLALLKNIAAFHALGIPLLVGHSRKSCFAGLTEGGAASRDPETYAASIYLMQQGVNYLRVHDVAGNARALKVAGYLWGEC